MKTARKGLTLIELIIVVLIIGAAAFVAVPRLMMATATLAGTSTGADRLAAAIRHCRTLAISYANTYPQGFRLDMTGSGSYTGFQIVNVQTSTVVESDTIASGVSCTGSNQFKFGPLGDRTGGSGNLAVSGGGKTYVISVITTTGMVQCTLQ
jgi:prepilin-type N-terminal cleavage/methylation domain-containing protein